MHQFVPCEACGAQAITLTDDIPVRIPDGDEQAARKRRQPNVSTVLELDGQAYCLNCYRELTEGYIPGPEEILAGHPGAPPPPREDCSPFEEYAIRCLEEALSDVIPVGVG
jgi:hypothetical protein